jgi:hypothetical protein
MAADEGRPGEAMGAWQEGEGRSIHENAAAVEGMDDAADDSRRIDGSTTKSENHSFSSSRKIF